MDRFIVYFEVRDGHDLTEVEQEVVWKALGETAEALGLKRCSMGEDSKVEASITQRIMARVIGKALGTES